MRKLFVLWKVSPVSNQRARPISTDRKKIKIRDLPEVPSWQPSIKLRGPTNLVTALEVKCDSAQDSPVLLTFIPLDSTGKTLHPFFFCGPGCIEGFYFTMIRTNNHGVRVEMLNNSPRDELTQRTRNRKPEPKICAIKGKLCDQILDRRRKFLNDHLLPLLRRMCKHDEVGNIVGYLEGLQRLPDSARSPFKEMRILALAVSLQDENMLPEYAISDKVTFCLNNEGVDRKQLPPCEERLATKHDFKDWKDVLACCDRDSAANSPELGYVSGAASAGYSTSVAASNEHADTIAADGHPFTDDDDETDAVRVSSDDDLPASNYRNEPEVAFGVQQGQLTVENTPQLSEELSDWIVDSTYKDQSSNEPSQFGDGSDRSDRNFVGYLHDKNRPVAVEPRNLFELNCYVDERNPSDGNHATASRDLKHRRTASPSMQLDGTESLSDLYRYPCQTKRMRLDSDYQVSTGQTQLTDNNTIANWPSLFNSLPNSYHNGANCNASPTAQNQLQVLNQLTDFAIPGNVAPLSEPPPLNPFQTSLVTNPAHESNDPAEVWPPDLLFEFSDEEFAATFNF